MKTEKLKGPYTVTGLHIKYEEDTVFLCPNASIALSMVNALNGAYVLGYTHRMLETEASNA